MNWTAEQILALAPDGASAKNGQVLATLRQWQNLGCSRELHGTMVVWGECQGSGATPYRTQIDLREPAFKCSCPSRKFPCKHGLGLLLLRAQDGTLFAEQAAPDWVEAWLSGRQARQQRQAETKPGSIEVAPEKPLDAVAQAKRAANRSAKVEAGLAELQQWLGDLLRQGVTTVQGYGAWDQIAARMVDAQAPGLARRLQEMAATVQSGEGWTDRLLEQLGQLQLIVESYERMGGLPPGLQADVRSQIGWTVSQAELLALPDQRLADRWWVLGQRDLLEDKLRLRRIWLWGEHTGRSALLLLFAHGAASFELSLVPGTILMAELAFFVSAYPQRAILAGEFAMVSVVLGERAITSPATQSIAEAIASYGTALGQQPWLERLPLVLGAVVPSVVDGCGVVWDGVSVALPIQKDFERLWQLVAISGSLPIDLCGEWDGCYFYPLSAWVNGQVVLI